MNHSTPNTPNTPNTSTSPRAEEDISHELETAPGLGGVGIAPAIDTQVDPRIERMKKVEMAFFGDPDRLLELVDAGEIGVDDTDFEERTGVMMMAARGHMAAVEGLAARGADLNRIKMYQGRIPMSALDAARQTNRKEIEQFLLDNGAKPGKEIFAEKAAAEQGL